MKYKRKVIFLSLCFLTGILFCYAYNSLHQYEMYPLTYIRPLYQVKEAFYYCDPKDNYQLTREIKAKHDVIIREKIHNYWIDEERLLYSTDTGLFLCDIDGGGRKQILDFPSSDGMDPNFYHSFYHYKNYVFFTYEYSKNNRQVLQYYFYDMDEHICRQFHSIEHKITSPLTREKYNIENTVLLADDEFYYYFDQTAVFKKAYKDSSNPVVLYESPTDMEITNAAYDADTHSIYLSMCKDYKYLFIEYDLDNLTVNHAFVKDDAEVPSSKTVIWNKTLLRLKPSGNYQCIDINGMQQASGHIPLMKNSIQTLYVGDDSLFVYTTFRYDAASYRITKLEWKDDLEVIDDINKISVWGRLKSYRAK